ncbi:hypothetical protein K402DRAFT_393925 [Aulographum hederae CBS 113979]|uniref:EH domain-containing protein n=1 Tax=Aulographum hederae CBS 113979 TaxID=1176131 RepID=A0A6G1GZQ1_9PEZI|nr:hypothetical protein K402DRAFT_393925 [Aulographum hederae CBS 113979]
MSSSSLSRSTSASDTPRTTQYNVHNAALIGASSAFTKKQSPANPLLNPQAENGALWAANPAARPLPRPISRRTSTTSTISEIIHVKQQSTGGSSRLSVSPAFSKASSSGMLGVPHSPDTGFRSSSPANIAATLAAARNSPGKSHTTAMSRQSTGGQNGAWPSAATVNRVNARLAEAGAHRMEGEPAGPPTDETSIPSTNSLVKMFEQNSSNKPAVTAKPTMKSKKVPPISAPKPQRLSGSFDPSSFTTLAKDEIGIKETRQQPSQATDVQGRSTVVHKPPPKPKTQVPARVHDTPSEDATSTPPPELKARPNVPPPRRTGKPTTSCPSSTPPKAIPRSFTGPQQSPNRHLSPHMPSNLGSGISDPIKRPISASTKPYQAQSLRQIQPHITDNHLANAIVGANLASTRSSRAPSPSKSPAPPPIPTSRRANHHHHTPFHRSRSRSQSPQKQQGIQLRRTMRSDPGSSSSSEDGHGKGRKVKHLVKKHPNKHHEGDRKRWREKITERERKRYEGVWAANKGLYLPPPSRSPSANPQSRKQSAESSGSTATMATDDDANDVAALVAREIWRRSRLNDQCLEEVWDLVDSRGVGRLSREEFVVGMWLVDQRLKGRKLPVKVGTSVWGSVRGLGARGVKIHGFKG